jgi:hypothetical protein
MYIESNRAQWPKLAMLWDSVFTGMASFGQLSDVDQWGTAFSACQIWSALAILRSFGSIFGPYLSYKNAAFNKLPRSKCRSINSSVTF